MRRVVRRTVSHRGARVHQIQLDGRCWHTTDDFYDSLLSALGAPAWHGRNLDALNDSLRGGDLNTVNPPLVITISGLATMGSEARAVVDRFVVLARDLREGGVP